MTLHLQAALNGDRNKNEHKNIPVTIQELTKDAVEAVKAGAGSIHIHPRDYDHRETLDPEVIAHALLGLRSAVHVPVGISTGEWIAGSKTLDLIKNWTVLPDFASVNIHEETAADIISLLLQKGIGIEAGVWTVESAQKFIGLASSSFCMRVLIEPMERNLNEAINTVRAIMAVLRKSKINVPWLLHGQDDSAWKILAYARAIGLSSRIGFEDTLVLPDGNSAESNRELIETASMY